MFTSIFICTYVHTYMYVATAHFDCLAMVKHLRKDLPSLSKLSYKNMKTRLMSNKVITNQERKEIDKMNGEDQMIEVLDILQVSLSSKQTTKFKGFLIAMEESDDELLKETAVNLGENVLNKLCMYIRTYVCSYMHAYVYIATYVL